LMGRDASEMSVSPAQNALKPPPVPEVAYALPGPAGTPAELVELAAGIERRLAGHYAAVAATAGGARLLGADLLVGTAVREVRWTGTPTALPGLQ